MEKKTPHYRLSTIKTLIDSGRIRSTISALTGGAAIGFEEIIKMKCPICTEAELVNDTRDIQYTYKGESTVIPAVTGDFCPACGEAVLDASESSRTSAAMLEFNKQVNASTVDPNFITSVRKKLALGQREAAKIFGGGVNAFSRYENGKTKPPLALIKLLKVLDRHPDLLNEIRSI